MTELEAIVEVRKKYHLAIPEVVAYGDILMLQENVTVARLKLQVNGVWGIEWSPSPEPVAVPAEGTELAMEDQEQVAIQENLAERTKKKG